MKWIDFKKEYEPVNNLSKNPLLEGKWFENKGKDLKFVQERHCSHVWSIVDYTLTVQSGKADNAVGYLVCVEPQLTNEKLCLNLQLQ